VNLVGMRRAGISEDSIAAIRQAHRLLFREHKKVDAVRDYFAEQLRDFLPFELSNLLAFVERQRLGKLGRAREAVRDAKPHAEPKSQRRVA
jgi:UDP-N-acetylglucosamine acyltransferase